MSYNPYDPATWPGVNIGETIPVLKAGHFQHDLHLSEQQLRIIVAAIRMRELSYETLATAAERAVEEADAIIAAAK